MMTTSSTSSNDDISKDIEYLLLYQKEQLIKLIAKSKGWNELELLNEFLIGTDTNSNCETKTTNSNIVDKKKRGRPKKTDTTIVLDKKKRGRPKKKIELENQETPKRKRGRPKKIVDMEIMDDPNIDLEEQCQDDNIDTLKSIDIETCKLNKKEMIDTIQMSFTSNDCIYSNSEDEDSSVEECECHCNPFSYKGHHYFINTCNNNVYETLIDNTNKRYDVNETKFVGRYNENDDSIDLNAIE